MKLPFLAVCLALSGAAFVAHGAGAAGDPAHQADAYPAIEQLIKDAQFDRALAAATKATSDNPRSARAFFLLGKAQYYREQDEAARAAFGKAIALAPAYADAYFFRGLTLAAGSRRLGGADLQRATELDPTKAKYWFELGRYSEHFDKNDIAKSAYEKAVAIDPTLVSAWYGLGTIAGKRNDYQAAAGMWEKVLAIDPKHADAHFNLGTHHQVRGDARTSLARFLAAAELQPDDVEAVKKVVQAYFRLNEYDTAASYRLKMLDLIAKSKDPGIRSMKEVCIDQFVVPEGRFFVYETIAKEAPFFYWYTFKLVDNTGTVVKTINLERNRALDEAGTMFMLGQNEGKVHRNFGIGFAQLPAYPSLKELVLKAHHGKLRVAASTRPDK